MKNTGALLLAFLLASCNVAVDAPVQPAGDRTPAIVGGQLSSSFAATGSLFYNGQHICTATLLRSDRLLTAAHCLEELPPGGVGQIEFVLGKDLFGSPKRARLTQAWLHPSYVPKQVEIGNDIALAALATPIEGVKPVAMHLGSPQQLMGQELVLVGYGRSENDETQGIRRETRVVLDEVTGMKISYAFVGKGGCYGDSGGPAFVQVSGGWWQVGITSHGTLGTPNCQERAYYSRIDVHTAWLAQHGINSGDRPRQCEGDGTCDGLCPQDPDCDHLFQGGGPQPGQPSPPPPPPGPKQGFGQVCQTHADCHSNLCAAGPAGLFCTQTCGWQQGCPSGYECFSTDQPGLDACAPAGAVGGTPDPPSLQGYGGPCGQDDECVSGFCAAHPYGGGYCTYSCDAYYACPPGGQCCPTQYWDLFICGPPGF